MSAEARDVPKDRYCDLVMKGGITSGVVYPKAITSLARAYRFHSIGGTSAGAIAATLTAAAEYRRREQDDFAGFEALERLPEELASQPKGAAGGKTTLLSLIRPDIGTRRLFESFLGSLERSTTGQRWRFAVIGILRAYLLTTALGIVLGLALAWPGAVGLAVVAAVAYAGLAWLTVNGWVALVMGSGLLMLGLPDLPAGGWTGTLVWWLHALVLIVIAVVACVGLHLYRDIVEELVPNGFGACRCGPGSKEQDAASPALTLWLHRKIQATAGLAGDQPDQVLTFRRLWQAKGAPWETIPDMAKPPEDDRPVKAGEFGFDAHDIADPRSINLTLFTANLTHGRPYIFPLNDATSRLFFEPEALRAYFPETVIDWMLGASCPYAPRRRDDPSADDILASQPGLREIPVGDLPVIVATRLSLSFPLLFSAVPLWSIDYSAPGQRDRTMGKGISASTVEDGQAGQAATDDPPGRGRIRQCWFSDGGICSNFPIHLFDSFIPSWPTFAISLEDTNQANVADDERAWLPAHHLQGRDDHWSSFNDKRDRLGQLGGFLAAAVSTAQNWADSSAARMPGVRERVVRISLRSGEGGLNLKMPAKRILDLGRAGEQAADALLKRYHGSATTPAPGWLEHRWIRFNTTVVAVRERLANLRVAATQVPYALPLAEQIARARQTAPLAADPDGEPDPAAKTLTRNEAESLQALLDAALKVKDDFDANAVDQPFKPTPKPTLRVRPPL